MIDLGTIDLIRKGEIDVINHEIGEISGSTVGPGIPLLTDLSTPTASSILTPHETFAFLCAHTSFLTFWQVKFADGSSRNFDYILLATGYTSGQGKQHAMRLWTRHTPVVLL